MAKQRKSPPVIISMKSCRQKLAVIWFAGAGILMIFVVLQCIRGVYADNVSEAIGWYLATVFPTLTLIGTVFAADYFGNLKSDVTERFIYRLTAGISIFYLLATWSTILLQPIAAGSSITPLGLMRMSQLWLGPIQGVAAGFMGIFFVNPRNREESATPTPVAPSSPGAADGGGG